MVISKYINLIVLTSYSLSIRKTLSLLSFIRLSIKMKFLKITCFIIASVLLILLAVGFGAFMVEQSKTSYLEIDRNSGLLNNSYVITNVNVVPMTTDIVLTNQTVRIVDGMIKSINEEAPTVNENVIDGNGAFLSPGLIDMHVHVWDRFELGLYLANGVTTVRNVWGLPMHLRMKAEIKNDEIIAPMFFTSGPKLTGPVFIGDDNLQLTSVQEAKDKVIEYKARGFDFIKTYNGITEPLFKALLEQAEASNIDVIAHPSSNVPYEYHLHPQISSIEHAEDIVQQPLEYKLDSIKLDNVVSKIAKSESTSFSPTLTVYYNIYRMLANDQILNSEQLTTMNPLIRMVDSQAQFDRWSSAKAKDPNITDRIKEQHKFHIEVIKRLHQQGANIVCSTDAGIGITPAGSSIHEELGFYVEAGMSNYEALKTATANPAKTHKLMENLGTLEAGKYANLLLTSGNPLEDLTTLQQPKLVIVKGRVLKREQLETFKEAARDRGNLIPSALRYAEYVLMER